jgi:peptidoglycan/LPS O-acetylase OafA/YrhL
MGATLAAHAEAPSPAVAPPPGNPRFALFDALRAIAVLAVMVFHVCLLSGALERPVLGDTAVQLGALGPIVFFAISGFLLYRPWVAARAAGEPAPATGRYARRRALRILPAYWVALTVLAVFPGITGVFTGDWWRYYLFLQAYDVRTLGLGIPVAWTLCVEVAFYIALPFWALLMRRLRVGAGPRAWLRTELLALGLLTAAAVAIQIAASRQAVSHLAAQSLLGQAAWLGLGMALAVASVAASERGTPIRIVGARPGLCWVGALAAFAALAILHRDVNGLLSLVATLQTRQPFAETVAGIALTAAVIVLLLSPAVFGTDAGGFPRRVLAAAPLAWLGVISYGVYLWHLTIAEFLARPALPAQYKTEGLDLAAQIPFAVTPILFILTLALSCAVAAASYRWIELPALRRKERPRRAR